MKCFLPAPLFVLLGAEATVLLQIRSRLVEAMPQVIEQELRPEMDQEMLRKAEQDPTVFLTWNGRVELAPGLYTLKAVFRDDRSGRMGGFETDVDALPLTGSSVPSSLLLTRQGRPRGGDRDADDSETGTPPSASLEVGDLELTPEPARVVRQGHVLHFAYHLYQPTAADYAVAERGVQMGLRRRGEWVVPGAGRAGGQAFPDREGDLIRFVGWVNTEELPPGRYTLLAALPNHQAREVPDLSEEFEVLPR